MVKIALKIFGIVGLTACSSGTTMVTATAVSPTVEEVFWTKNEIAEKTDTPGQAQFGPMIVMALSNGDRVYCGEMRQGAKIEDNGAYTPFYLRASGRQVRALNWAPNSAGFSQQKCAEAKSGRLRINDV